MKELDQAGRHRIDNVDALQRVMHEDRRYALALYRHAEEHITLLLRRKFFRMPPELVVDAFNEAFLQFLRTKTFRNEHFQRGQPSMGWTAPELFKEVLAGYLYVSALRELVRHARVLARELDIDSDAAKGVADLADENPFSDPAQVYEEMEFARLVQECIERLGLVDRKILAMYLDETPIAEIAASLDEVNPGTLKTRLYRLRYRVIECAKRRLR